MRSSGSCRSFYRVLRWRESERASRRWRCWCFGFFDQFITELERISNLADTAMEESYWELLCEAAWVLFDNLYRANPYFYFQVVMTSFTEELPKGSMELVNIHIEALAQ